MWTPACLGTLRAASLVAALAMLGAQGAVAAGEALPYGSVVRYLEYIVEGDPDLGRQLETNLSLAGASGPNQAYWNGKRVRDLYPFFDDWLVNPLKPTKSRTGFEGDRIVRHSYVFRNLLNADPTLRAHNAFMGWLALFMNARQQFLLTAESGEHLPAWMADPAVSIEDYVVPPQGFPSFNAFFLRRLAPGARVISDPDDDRVAVSPVDCEVYQLFDARPGAAVTVKGDRLDFHDLLDGNPIASRFEGGPAYTCNLRLYDYHHFHSPVAGRVATIGQVGGVYYFDPGFKHLYQHRRAYLIFETEELGLVALVAAGQVMINTIRMIVGEGDVVEKGQELGHFDFGGSEVVLIFQPDRVRLAEELEPGHTFKLGNPIAVAR